MALRIGSIVRVLIVLSICSRDLLVESRGCGQSCSTNDDCDGQLYCGGGRTCQDDPDLGTHICAGSGGGGGGGSGTCQQSGTLKGNSAHQCGECCKANTNYPIYRCSPPVSQSTKAILTVNDFQAGGDGGDPSECDGKFHSNTERVVALSTGWYSGGSRCLKFISITAPNGRSTTAKVVDECDSTMGCDKPHAWQPPCRNNIVDGSDAVWKALGISSSDPLYGQMSITWRDA
ncbi:hypothetical protein SELMODRAFT_443242 [Selaginella moellendorffii]|uniref:Uncharacterized protein n=1 Tax=Selaginella moellendorffii TaxID=88036 RepID=D8RZS9_SELML|nr:putative ripening-related protein 1 [Selaginella moellendorffii]EFJ22351.1 hypothetical protein SELMODRAFT_443242 [Selaginella moellendorffii]|eukprot:XP_002976682.1 putative ripening-related protein 1 [Selaginella moellendorffii]